MSTVEVADSNRRVCVWFGEQKIVEHISESEDAVRFESAMRCRFKSLRVTNEPAAVLDADLS